MELFVPPTFSIRRISLLTLALSLSFLAAGTQVHGEIGELIRRTEKRAGSGVIPSKVQRSVLRTVERLRVQTVAKANANDINPARLSTPVLRVDRRDRLHLYLQLADVSSANLAALNPTGDTEIELVSGELKLVQAWVPYDSVETIAALDFVLSVRPPDYGIRSTGSVSSQGDAILKANLARSTGVTGTGIKVGVISDGANNASAAQASGDLPSSIAFFGSCDPAVTHSDCNEGTAMLEIVHDLAPGAELAMAAGKTSLEFFVRVSDLRNWGAKVIVDDLGFLTQPFFEDGFVAAAYSIAVSQGVVVVSAAGNLALNHYQALFVDRTGDSVHDFLGSDDALKFMVPAGETGGVVLQWTNRFGQSADDYDLYIADDPVTTIIGGSDDPQTGTQDPIEGAVVTCESQTRDCTFNVGFHRFSGSIQTLELFFLPNTIPLEYFGSADSIFGHTAVPGVISIGTIQAGNPGNLAIAAYSSRGPSTINFPSFQQRASPTLTAIDCVSVTGVGGFGSPFCGTSAAAPHAGAVAALLLQANPSMTATQIRTLMQTTAIERGVTGYDNTYGFGLIDALAAVTNGSATISSLSPNTIVRGSAAFTLTVNGTNFVSGSTVRWNGVARATTFGTSTRLTASILVSDIVSAGTAQITVASPTGIVSAPVSFSITAGAPSFTAAGFVNGSSFAGRSPAGASIASLFGSNLATATTAAASLPLPTTLGATTVRLNNLAVPLFFVSPAQINFQVPFALFGQTSASLTVTVGTTTSASVSVSLSPVAPGIFTTNSQGTGQGAILIANSTLLAATNGSVPGRQTQPVSRGGFITIFCTGLGDVSNRPLSGSGAPASPLASTLTPPTVTIGGINAPVGFSGLSPGFVGLYQVNVQIPQNAPAGSAVPVALSIGGAVANTVTIAVQ
jgi:uncharacterized protein (TIGR03437 family)